MTLKKRCFFLKCKINKTVYDLNLRIRWTATPTENATIISMGEGHTIDVVNLDLAVAPDSIERRLLNRGPSFKCFESPKNKAVQNSVPICPVICPNRFATIKEEKEMPLLICNMIPILVANRFTTQLIASVKQTVFVLSTPSPGPLDIGGTMLLPEIHVKQNSLRDQLNDYADHFLYRERDDSFNGRRTCHSRSNNVVTSGQDIVMKIIFRRRTIPLIIHECVMQALICISNGVVVMM